MGGNLKKIQICLKLKVMEDVYINTRYAQNGTSLLILCCVRLHQGKPLIMKAYRNMNDDL